MKVKSAALALGLLATFGMPVGHADPMTGDGINGAVAREMCASDWNAAFGFVVGMETARHHIGVRVEFRESLVTIKDGIKTPLADSIKKMVCVPEGVPMEDRVGMFCKFLELNQDEDTDKYSAFSAYTKAMGEVWPCD